MFRNLPLNLETPARIGVVGTGFIACGLLSILAGAPDMRPARVLSRRNPTELSGLALENYTDSVQELIDTSDLIVECSGDVHHGAEVIHAAMAAGKPVVTIGTEFHVTVGSWFVGKGMLTEAEGDQPGSLAALHEEVTNMGFRPLVYGNIKGFLNHHPTDEEMEYWSRQQGISIQQVRSFTDGTKVQMEQAFIGNGLGAGIITRGLLGPAGLSLKEGGELLASRAKTMGKPIADYLLNHHLPAGVFITAEHPHAGMEVLRYLKMGEGPYYTLLRPYHLCHLEAPRTIRRVLRGGPPLLDNSAYPTLGVCAVAKRKLEAGENVVRGHGGNKARGEAFALAEIPDAAPLGLLAGSKIRRRVQPGDVLTLDDVELPDTFATRIWHELRERAKEPVGC
ncbi:MAG: NAD(P)-dependent oxidoreductase [Verrucomicrobiales bacterium]